MLTSINADFEKRRGKPGGYPADLAYSVTKTKNGFELCIEDARTGSNIWKLADPWGLAAFQEMRQKHTALLQDASLALRFVMRTPEERERPKHEALKRRLSYLAAVNKIPIILSTGGREDPLYTLEDLASRPEAEIVRTNFRSRGDKDAPGRLEKDFQAYLFGKGLYKEDPTGIRTNERLALFGYDFIGVSNRGLAVEREFPTGAFSETLKASARILPTEYVDLVTINRWNEVAIIEIKFDDAPLEVIAQLLNYALFFHSYRAQIAPLLQDKGLLPGNNATYKMKAYLVSNVFHRRFADVWPYYACGTLAMRQVIMGYMPCSPGTEEGQERPGRLGRAK